MGMQMSFDDGVVRGVELAGVRTGTGRACAIAWVTDPLWRAGGAQGLQSGLPVGRGDG